MGGEKNTGALPPTPHPGNPGIGLKRRLIMSYLPIFGLHDILIFEQNVNCDNCRPALPVG